MRAIGLATAVLLAGAGGCQWAITPDPVAGSAESIRHGEAMTMTEMRASRNLIYQGDQEPIEAGQSYVIFFVYQDDPARARRLTDDLVQRGVTAAVGHMVSHGQYYVRSADAYDWDDPDDRAAALDLIQRGRDAMVEIYNQDRDVLESPVSNIPPYAMRMDPM